MRTALLLSMHNLHEWSANTAAIPGPGGPLPYGLHHLRDSFTLTWTDAQRAGLWRSRPARAAGGAVRRAAPGLQGTLGGCYAAPRQRTANVALSVFENAGLGFARIQRLPGAARRALPHVMLACWLAEDCQHMTAFQLRSVRRSLQSVDAVAVFSANQVSILHAFLAIPEERIEVVPFGVDTEYYSAAAVTGPAGGGGVIAVGGDSRRDYATLLAAARLADMPVTLVCYPRNIAGLDVPPQVTVRSAVFHDEYRKLLRSADLVVTPTLAPAYPSGQSVVLEAMSMGRATVTTDSPAMRDYVTDGVDGVLVPPRDPAALAQLMTALMTDTGRRQLLGTAAAHTVQEDFSLRVMWQHLAKLMTGVGRPGHQQRGRAAA